MAYPVPVRTLGVDLASQAERTALCLVDWTEEGTATVAELVVGVDDDRLLSAHRRADVTGIDCPFGWPERFRQFVAGQHVPPAWTDDLREALRYRLTDLAVQRVTGRWPLSVSSDLIAVPAMRCQLLLRRLEVTDRSGDGRVFEVYPAGSLKVWGLESRGYKRQAGRSALTALFDDLRRSAPWLDAGGTTWKEVLSSCDDAFDALVAALTARAAGLGLTVRPPADQHEVAVSEGWIALPQSDSFNRLAGHVGY